MDALGGPHSPFVTSCLYAGELNSFPQKPNGTHQRTSQMGKGGSMCSVNVYGAGTVKLEGVNSDNCYDNRVFVAIPFTNTSHKMYGCI